MTALPVGKAFVFHGGNNGGGCGGTVVGVPAGTGVCVARATDKASGSDASSVLCRAVARLLDYGVEALNEKNAFGAPWVTGKELGGESELGKMWHWRVATRLPREIGRRSL